MPQVKIICGIFNATSPKGEIFMKLSVKKLTTCAVSVALASVLSLICVFKMPLGGSVTLLSMLPVCLVAIKYGTKTGFVCSFIFSLVQLLLGFSELMAWGLTPQVLIGSFLLDYIVAYSVLGFAGIFGKKSTAAICFGICFAMVLRFLSHFLSGVILFGSIAPDGWNPTLYSLCYNGAYMLPEMIFTAAGAFAIFRLPQTSKIITE